MHFSDASPSSQPPAPRGAWWKGLTRYQWFVFVVASLGWLFDTMDQQLFNLARKPAITQPAAHRARRPVATGQVDEYAGYATTIFMIGWASAARLRHPRRPDRPGQDDDADDPALFGLHRPERLLDGRLGLRLLPLPDRPGRRRRVRRRRLAGGRGHARPRPADGAGLAPGALGGRQHDGGRRSASVLGELRGVRRDRQRLAGDVRDRHAPRAARHPDLPAAQGARAVEGRGARPRSELDGDRQAASSGSLAELFGDPRWRRNTIVGMLLAFAGRGRPLGDRLLQLRPDPTRSSASTSEAPGPARAQEIVAAS